MTSSHTDRKGPVCEKPFKSAASLAQHTGTSDPIARKAHKCGLCRRKFCSETANSQHLSTAHARKEASGTTSRESRHRSAAHTNENARVAKGSTGNTVIMWGSWSTPMRPKTPKPKARLKTKTNANTEASNGPRRNTGAMGGSAGGSIYGVCDDDLGGQANHYWRSAYGNGWGHSFDNGHEDWALCDKDCGWCGHCADNIDI